MARGRSSSGLDPPVGRGFSGAFHRRRPSSLWGSGDDARGVHRVVRMPDTYTRQHAASKMVFLGVITLLLASALPWDNDIVLRVTLIAVFLLLTTPVSSHMVGPLISGERGCALPNPRIHRTVTLRPPRRIARPSRTPRQASRSVWREHPSSSTPRYCGEPSPCIPVALPWGGRGSRPRPGRGSPRSRL